MIIINVKKNIYTAEGLLDLKVKINVPKQEFITIFGKSGVGKTTLLRMIAGLLDPDDGFIQVDDVVWFDKQKKINLPADRRNLGFVFQEYNLFPNMSIRDNLRFAFKSKPDEPLIDYLLSRANLTKVENLKPDILSGGQKQRAALMRALVKKPKIFLLDEPLSALEESMRQNMQDLILELFEELKVSVFLVSHDLGEIFKLSNKVVVIDKGKIINQGSPLEVFAPGDISCKFKFEGVILSIKKADLVYIVVVKINNQFAQVVATEEEIKGLKFGDHVIVGSKAFNPVIFKANKQCV
ncbi:MAG: ATP-binding cassette domain-containing protein [Candidatus Omnitrophica bacterium]|nr:ATP-binding cassette domain-containing protein [Candidatus Omnitrophota bacterium]